MDARLAHLKTKCDHTNSQPATKSNELKMVSSNLAKRRTNIKKRKTDKHITLIQTRTIYYELMTGMLNSMKCDRLILYSHSTNTANSSIDK